MARKHSLFSFSSGAVCAVSPEDGVPIDVFTRVISHTLPAFVRRPNFKISPTTFLTFDTGQKKLHFTSKFAQSQAITAL